MAKPDKATMTAYLDELGISDALKANLLQELEADEARANNFVGQRLRQSDYTKKTQDLAEQRRQIDVAVTQQVKEYADRLQEADGKLAKILKDYEAERISRATAENRLSTIATKYEIPKEDLADLISQPPNGAPPKHDGGGLTLEAVSDLMAKREADLIKRLMPELISFPKISNIQQEIRERHLDLTGKRMTAREMDELMAEATKDNSGGLMGVWQTKYDIPKIEMERHDKGVADAAIAEYERKAKARASEDALSSVHHQDSSRPYSTSPVLRQYRDRSKEGGELVGDTKNGNGNGNGNGKPPERAMSGSERAAVKWVERRNQGIGFGKEAPAK